MAEKMITLFKKLFKKEKQAQQYIRFYTLEPGVLDLFPIVPSSSINRKFMEDDQIGDMVETLSSKNCPGIRKIISSGWVVPAPADFIIKTNGDGVSLDWKEPYRFSKVSPNRDAYVSGHTRSQVEPLLDNSKTTLKTVVKLETPWRFEASNDLMLLQLPISYNNESRFTAATGFLDARYGHTLNIQLFWNELNSETLIRAGTPMCQLIPVSKKMLSLAGYDVKIEKATSIDEDKERAFNYAANCVILKHDSLASRLKRSMSILKKYKKEM